MPESIAYNMDCLEYMRSLLDKYFDLCVADPPYGAGFAEEDGCQGDNQDHTQLARHTAQMSLWEDA